MTCWIDNFWLTEAQVSLNILPHHTSVTVAGLTGLLLLQDTKSREVPAIASQVVFPLSPNTRSPAKM